MVGRQLDLINSNLDSNYLFRKILQKICDIDHVINRNRSKWSFTICVFDQVVWSDEVDQFAFFHSCHWIKRAQLKKKFLNKSNSAYSRYRLVCYRIRREIGYKAICLYVCVYVENRLEREIAYSADFFQSQVPRTKRYPVYFRWQLVPLADAANELCPDAIYEWRANWPPVPG